MTPLSARHSPSWPDLSRPSTPVIALGAHPARAAMEHIQVIVDGRDKPCHDDEVGELHQRGVA